MRERAKERGKKRKKGGRPVASGIPNMGLSLPARCLFVSPRQGVKRERMKATGAEEQEGEVGEEDGGDERSLGWDHLRCPLCGERLCGHTKAMRGAGQGRPGWGVRECGV